MSNHSSEFKRDTKCEKCGMLLSVCQCDTNEDLASQTFKAFLSVETRGSTNDVLTVIEKLPGSEPYLKTLLKRLSSECQTRGTYKLGKTSGMIELIGDKRKKLRAFFEQEKIPYVG